MSEEKNIFQIAGEGESEHDEFVRRHREARDRMADRMNKLHTLNQYRGGSVRVDAVIAEMRATFDDIFDLILKESGG